MNTPYANTYRFNLEEPTLLTTTAATAAAMTMAATASVTSRITVTAQCKQNKLEPVPMYPIYVCFFCMYE